MAYKINDNCINCGTCVSACPMNCINSGKTKHIIDNNLCISCGSCRAVCPVEAPYEEIE